MIFVFGTVCLDQLRQIPSWPKVGGYVEMTSDEIFLGGEATNTASHLARWGSEVILAGNNLGTGDSANQLRRLLLAHGLSDQHLPDGGETAICEVYVTPDGERTMIGKGFSTMEFSSPLDSLPWQAGDWFSAEPNLGDRARQVVREAIQREMRIYLMDFFQPTDPIIPGSFWQCSTDWMGKPGDIPGNVRLMQNWVARHGCFAILTDGPSGYIAGGPDFPVQHFTSPRPRNAIDATGAGDAFRAGMLYALSQDWPIEKCLRFAAASGSLKCGWLGGSSAKHTVEETLLHAGL